MNYLQNPWSIFLISTGLSLGSETLRDGLWNRRWVPWAFPDYPACVIGFTVQPWAGSSQGSFLKVRSFLLHSKMDFYVLQMSSWESHTVHCKRGMGLVLCGCFLEPADKLHMGSWGAMRSLSLVWAVFLAQCPLNVDMSSGDLFVQSSSISPLSLASGFSKKSPGRGKVQHALLLRGQYHYHLLGAWMNCPSHPPLLAWILVDLL